MGSKNLAVVLVFLVIQSSCLVLGVRIQEFYPDGIVDPRGFSELLARRVSPTVTLGTTYVLYGKSYRNLRVSTIDFNDRRMILQGKLNDFLRGI